MTILWKWKWWMGGALMFAVVWIALGRWPEPAATAATAATAEDKTYAVTPAAMKVRAGILTGDVMDMKVTERVERGSGRVVTQARLTGKLVLKNGSANQSVRLLAGKVRYIDGEGRPIKLEDTRSEATLELAAYGNERLDPGQEATRSLDVPFPAEALKANRLEQIRLDLAYIPSPYREETITVPVSIGSP